MKLAGLVCIIPLLAGVSAQDDADRSKYSEICPDKHEDKKTYDNGYEITYLCKATGKADTLLSTDTIKNPDDCAMACNSQKGCKGSAWRYTNNECTLYSEGETSDAELRASIFMRRESPEKEEEKPEEGEAEEETQPVDCSETEHALKDCEASEKELTDKLATCNKEKKECCDGKKKCEDEKKKCEDERKKCGADKAKCEAEKNKCQAALKSCGSGSQHKAKGPAIPNCPHIHGQTARYGNRNFATWCNHLLGGARTIYKQNALPFEECLAACSKDGGCKGVQYILNTDAPCKMQGVSNGQAGPATTWMMVAAALR
ncbi:hypothetical protein PLIIFM63780_003557 [Purpureocillium lilacinum]|nr:hypothetical protein PLIIFM63780_003557 [Purpureocillium lilacinum]